MLLDNGPTVLKHIGDKL